MKWSFIVLCFLGIVLIVRPISIPGAWIEQACSPLLPTNIVMHVGSVGVGLLHGLEIRELRLYDLSSAKALDEVMSADLIRVHMLRRRVEAVALTYERLPDSYYAPGNLEKNARVEATLPEIPPFSLTLIRPNILAVRPEKVVADIKITPKCFEASRIHLDWPDQDEPMFLDGFCKVDLDAQQITGEVDGSAKQAHIRPLLVALDVPVSLPYMDGFTEVPGKVPAYCGWKVNLINNDFDLYLNLHPTMGRYNLVPMKKADGKIHLHVYTRGTSLNYRQTIGPIKAVGAADENLDGTVIVSGTNGYNVVDVEANSMLPVADLMKIGGFSGDYVSREVKGNAKCKLQFRFPRAMTNNYEVLNGHGHVEVMNGQVLRAKGFAGLLALMAENVPGIAAFTDSTQASCDYRIENGVIKTDNIFIEGAVFSIMMYGEFDAVNQQLDFTARVQFAKKESWMGKILHPITWPFTKLLLEFKLEGSPDEPKWRYLTVVDRVMEAVK